MKSLQPLGMAALFFCMCCGHLHRMVSSSSCVGVGGTSVRGGLQLWELRYVEVERR